MPKPLKPPLHVPTLTKVGLERLGVYGTRWMWVGLLAVAMLWPFNPGPLRAGPTPTPARPQVPLQEATTDAVPRIIVKMALGEIPDPGDGQKRSGQCDPQGSEVELRGGCWIKTEHPLPCPKGKQWDHDGRCWRPVFRAAVPPTSGEPRASNVAGEP